MTLHPHLTSTVNTPTDDDRLRSSHDEERHQHAATHLTVSRSAELIRDGMHLCVAMAWASLGACEAAELPLEAAPTVVRDASYHIAVATCIGISDPDDTRITPTLLALAHGPTRTQTRIVGAAARALAP